MGRADGCYCSGCFGSSRGNRLLVKYLCSTGRTGFVGTYGLPATGQAFHRRAAVFARGNHQPRTADSSPPTPPLCILPSSGVMIQWQPFKFPYRQSKNAGCLDELKLVSPSPVKSFIIITPAKHSISNPFSSRIFLSLSTEASIPA